MPHTDVSIAIVGGALGGLTAALSLLHGGFDVQVYERATVLREVGARTRISSSGRNAPNPKFASLCGSLVCELRNRGTLGRHTVESCRPGAIEKRFSLLSLPAPPGIRANRRARSPAAPIPRPWPVR